MVNASPPTSSWLTQDFDRTSQMRTVPSVEQLANSESRTGLKRTFSIPAAWPRRSVEYLACARSGFQMRRVRFAEPVAISCPVGFHAIVRILQLQQTRVFHINQPGLWFSKLSVSRKCYSGNGDGNTRVRSGCSGKRIMVALGFETTE